MVRIEELFEADLEAASKVACELIPDVVAALDRLMPHLVSGGSRMTLRRYSMFVDAAAQALTALPARHPDSLPPASVVYLLLRRVSVELPWVAPSVDGLGIVTVLVDRLRGFAGGLPQQCVRPRRDLDVHRFYWFLRSMAEIEHEQESGSPLRRAMTTLDLSSSDVADLMGVKRQAVDKWLLTGPPVDRTPKIGAIAEIADLLRYRLRHGMPAVVARRSAEAYGGRSMLDLIAQDEHEWLRQSVKESFDFTRVA
ncbi:MAG: helix-turn-helix transcriptional regulator [Acidimicrobiia bacterium]|nr:helix-turn-helix transcriptional regulator [Acidimicrobiia bacterium]